MIVAINTLSSQPIFEQLRDQIVLGIAAGRLSPGEALPSVRRMAGDLGINLHTVNKGYTALCDEGYLLMDRRRGAIIAPQIADDAGFREGLAQKLHLAAAQAVCHGLDESAFLEMCAAGYKNAIGENGRQS